MYYLLIQVLLYVLPVCTAGSALHTCITCLYSGVCSIYVYYLFVEQGSGLGLVAVVLGVAATQSCQVLHDGVKSLFVI